MGGGNLSKGFAVSGVLYPILILIVFLTVQMLTMLATRKIVLDKNKNQLVEQINSENQVYTNDQLSAMLSNQAAEIEELKKANNNLKTLIDGKLSLTGGTLTGNVTTSAKINNLRFHTLSTGFTEDDFLNKFETLVFGSKTSDAQIATFRYNASGGIKGATGYGSGIAWSGGGETQGYLYADHSTNLNAFIGGGVRDKLNWIRKIAFNGDVYTVSSDRRLKYDIKDIDDNLVKVYMDIKPVVFKYKLDEEGKIHTGVIAQQVIEIFQKHGLDYKKYGIIDKLENYQNGIDYYSINYENLDTLTMLITQYQEEKINKLETKLNAMEERLSKLESAM